MILDRSIPPFFERLGPLALSLTLVLTLLLTLPALASPQIGHDEPIAMELNDADLVEVLQSFAAIGGAQPDIDATLEGKVTVRVENTPWSEALDDLCLEHDLECLWIQGDPPTLRIRPAGDGYAGFPENISLALRRADRSQVLTSFEAITDGAVTLVGEFEGAVSLESRGVPWPYALLQVCADGGCEVDFASRPVVITALSGASLRPLSLPAGDPRASLRSVLRAPSLAELVAELEVEGELPVRMEALEAAGNWVNALDRFCELHRCRWFLEYGDPSVLRVVMRDPRIDQPIDFHGSFEGGFTAVELAERLASAIDVEPSLSELADRTARIELEAGGTWAAAADALARALGGQWRVESGELRIHVPTRPVGARRQATRARIGFDYGDASGTAGGAVEMDWSHSVHRVRLEPSDGQAGGQAWLTLSWIPFGPDHQVIVPSVQTCSPVKDGVGKDRGTNERTVAAVGPLVTLFGDDPVEAREEGRSLKAERLWGDEIPTVEPEMPRIGCLVNNLRLVLQARSEGADRAFDQVLLGERIGQYFLFAKGPGRSQEKAASPSSTVSSALVLVGQDGRGRLQLAHVRPGMDGAGPTVERLELGVGERLRLDAAFDDLSWVIDLRAEER